MTRPRSRLSSNCRFVFIKKLKATANVSACRNRRFDWPVCRIRFQFAPAECRSLVLPGIRVQSRLDNDKIIDCSGTPDDEMINAINVAFVWNRERNSVQMKFQTLHCVARVFRSARSLRLHAQILMTALNWCKIAALMVAPEREKEREREDAAPDNF